MSFEMGVIPSWADMNGARIAAPRMFRRLVRAVQQTGERGGNGLMLEV
jgi:hypothetical protein